MVTDVALCGAVANAPGGLAPREIRRALQLGPSITSTQLSRILADATSRGLLRRSGKGPGTRYHRTDRPPTDPTATFVVRVLHDREPGGGWRFESPDVPGATGRADTHDQSVVRAEWLLRLTTAAPDRSSPQISFRHFTANPARPDACP